MATIVERRNPSGVTYRAVVRIAGFPPKTKTFKTRTHAKAWARQEEARIRNGEVEDVLSKARTCTVAELIDTYCSSITPTHALLTQTAEPSYLNWWKRRIGKRPLAQVTSELLCRCMAACASEPIRQRRDATGGTASTGRRSKQTLKHYRNVFDRVLKKAVEWKWLGANPMEGVPRIKKINNQRVRFLSERECKALLDACRRNEQPCLYPMVVFALSTGARHGEIRNLTLADIDLEHGLATFHRTKNAEPRRVHIRGHLTEVLAQHVRRVQALYEEEGIDAPRWLFPRADGLLPIDIRAAWQASLEEAGIQDFRFHDLRHTAASYLAMNGATLMEIATVLGHRTLQMVQRYAHISDKHTADVVERMNLKMFGQGSPRPSGRSRRATRRNRATASSQGHPEC